MYVLELSQDDHKIELGIFNSISEGREFISQIAAYSYDEEDNELYEYLCPDKLPDYFEINFNGNIVPITRFMFFEKTRIEIIWKEMPVLSAQGTGIVEGTTKVDAYIIDNKDVKEYILHREKTYRIIKQHLEEQGFKVERQYLGSEDGEAIMVCKDNGDWQLICHLDPYICEDPDIIKTIDEIISDLI
ncbi:hypothetical protein [Mannheimia massilioguelmaensis]|uniref:hypothetical protein n=1 Tax=Mannheimia massilioguelmaensis TaxID=1604354 RepID=UPI0005C94D16|nr:hypothetical protein [Mannheimia massilioguelmaensis]